MKKVLKFDLWYYALNLVAIAVHTGLAIWGFYSLSNKDNTLKIHRDVMVRRFANETIACEDCTSNNWQNQSIVFKKECTGEWNGLLVLTWSEVCTALFHLLYLVEYQSELFGPLKWTKLNAHPLRWLEYSVSATLYSLANMVGIGVRNVYTLIFAGVCLVCVQILGGQAEYGIAQYGKASQMTEGQKKVWEFFVFFNFTLATMLQVTAFFIIGLQIASSPDGGFEREDGKSFDGFQTQTAFYVIQYLFFPFIFFYHWSRVRAGFSLEISCLKSEITYIVASVLTKSQIYISTFTTVSELYSNYLEIDPKSDTNWQAIRLVTGTFSVITFIVVFVILQNVRF